MIPRDEYLDNLISFKDKRLIKVGCYRHQEMREVDFV